MSTEEDHILEGSTAGAASKELCAPELSMEENAQGVKQPTENTSLLKEPLRDVCVPRKKRMMKGQPRQMQSSIDVLAEVLAEKCAEGVVEESEDLYEPGEDGSSSEDNEEPSNDHEKNSTKPMKSSKMEPYKFTKCKLKNRHFLREGQGLDMIRRLGLDQFLLHAEVPRFNRAYCTEFITTYNHHKGSGVVNGRVIRITAQAVRKLTGLPLGNRGDRAVVHDVRTEDQPVMERLIPGLKRTSYGYDLRYLRYKDQTETFVAVASALSEKLVCRTFKLTYIKGAIILAMETSLRLKILMQWAEFMAETMRNAVKLTKLRTRNVRFAFGEWLTGMIENALSEEEGGLVENEPLSLAEVKSVEKGEPKGEDHVTEEDPVLAIGLPELPVVAKTLALHPHKIKKRLRTPDNGVRTTDNASEEIRRLQQQLLDADKRERWLVGLNMNMSREIERLQMELESVKMMEVALQRVKETETPDATQENEMRMILSNEKQEQTLVGPKVRNGEEQLHIEKMMEQLERRNIRHEQEVTRLRQEVEEQKNLIELIRKSRGAPFEGGKESSVNVKREQKRLRREWEKEKTK